MQKLCKKTNRCRPRLPKITAATITGLALVYVIGIERSIRLASALGLVSVQSANAMRGILGITAATRGLVVAETAATG